MNTFSKLDISYLMPADILVSTTNAVVSNIIRVGTHSVVSHAMLYIGEGNVIEAVGEGVNINLLKNNIDSHGYRNVAAFRYPSLSMDNAKLIVTFATNQKGKGYDYSGVIGGAENSDVFAARSNPSTALLVAPAFLVGQLVVHHFASGGSFNNKNKYFCSELVFESFQKSGINLINDAPYMSYPQQIIDLANKGTLSYLGNLN
jgi:uncharacterized protein YycO